MPPAVPLRPREQITTFEINTIRGSTKDDPIMGPWNLLDEGSFAQAALAAQCTEGSPDEMFFAILEKSGTKDDIVARWKEYFQYSNEFKHLNKGDAMNDLVDYFKKKEE